MHQTGKFWQRLSTGLLSSALAFGAFSPMTTVMAEGEPGNQNADEWKFTFFGVSVGDNRNKLVSSGNGVEEPVVLQSATFKEDGSIDLKGGKFVADAPADGGSYYYTTIDPTTQNFYLQADVHIDQVNPSFDGQEGFALMARDAMGDDGATGDFMANLVSVTGTQLPIDGSEKKGTIGIRAYTGIYKPESTAKENAIVTTRRSWSGTSESYSTIAAGETYRVSLEKKDFGYIVRQVAINEDGTDGEEIGSEIYYIPAKDSKAETIESYSDLLDPLTFQENNTAYVALAVARGLNATFSNIVYTTSDWSAEGWHRQPTTYIENTYAITSPDTTTSGQYELVYKTNADGTANIYKNDVKIDENVAITANTLFVKTYEMAENEATFAVEFTPDPNYTIGDFETIASYETHTTTKKVTQKALGADGTIYVTPEGKPGNTGASLEDAVDIQTAFDFVGAGQKILLASTTYDLSGQFIKIARGRNGTKENPITLTTVDGKYATFDFGETGNGFEAWGDWWVFEKINVARTKDEKPGMKIAGSHNIASRMNFYNNGNTGLQVSGTSNETIELWPSYNTVINCTSVNNADRSVEDADGFAAKLTTGCGNVFDGCISAFNADDGWDLFAKIATGSIGAVTIKNSVAYKNGYLMVKSGTKADFVLADVLCDENGTLTFAEGSHELDAGNGNGFKMGGSNMPGGHVLSNSISYDNKTKGIDSNSCPDIKVYNSTTYNNGNFNIALYTSNKKATTGFEAKGVLSYRKGTSNDEQLGIQSQSESSVYGISNYYWKAEENKSSNTVGTTVSDDWFVSLDTSIAPTRKEDGSIDMHGVLILTDEARSLYDTGARGAAWGQKEATIWAVGDSTVSPFTDKYYLPREGYGEELATYFNATVYNLGHSGASSKDFTTMTEYDALMNGSDKVKALGDADTDMFLVIGFGHNDEKTEEARFTDPTGDYLTEGSFANSIYVNYVQPAIERGVVPIVCTPIARLTKENTTESYNGESGHITKDVTIGENVFHGGDYAQALRDMVATLKSQGVEIELVDLTAKTIEKNVEMGENAQYLHAFTGAKKDEEGNITLTGLDQTHTNSYGARMNAWLIANGSAGTKLGQYSANKPEPTYDTYFPLAINQDYVFIDYNTPTEEQMNASLWPQYTDTDGKVWRGTAFGDIGADKISPEFFGADIDDKGITLHVTGNNGKIAGGSDGLMLYYTQLPAGTSFTLTAKAKINNFDTNNQVSFGLMARDDLYIDTRIAETMGDYVAAGIKNQGKKINYGRKSSSIVDTTPDKEESINAGTEVELKLSGTADGFTLTYDGQTNSAGFDYPLTGVDSEYIYVGFFVVRNCNITFSDIHLTYGAEPKVEVAVEDEEAGTAEVIENADGTVTVKATVSPGYTFLGWKDAEGNIVSTDAEYTFTPSENITLTPVFAEEDKYIGFKLADGTPFSYLSADKPLYWYENGIRQGVYGDLKNVKDTQFNQVERGREIYDPNTDAWYWLDADAEGAVARNKEVWMPYVFQGDNNPDGKWVRYDKYGEMIKGWYANDNGVYYYDLWTGAMFKGEHVINDKTYNFDPITGTMIR